MALTLRILTLNTNPGFEHNESWKSTATPIAVVDRDWHRRTLLGKAVALLRLARGFDVILFHSDSSLAFLSSVLQRLFATQTCLVFQGLLHDTNKDEFRFRATASRWLHRMLVHNLDAVIVYTTAETRFLSQRFGTPESKFVFIPYFCYIDTEVQKFDPGPATVDSRSPLVVAVGRHRDYDCFIRAVAGTQWNAIIVGGSFDREELSEQLPANIEAHFELSREQYRDQISRASIVVLPFYKDRWRRSLGQIAMFEAISMRKPIIAAESFHLADYASDMEILYYRAGDSDHLRAQITRLLADPDLQRQLVENAYSKMKREFKVDKYIERLISVCERAASIRTTKRASRVQPATALR